jgi:hypothetical protein
VLQMIENVGVATPRLDIPQSFCYLVGVPLTALQEFFAQWSSFRRADSSLSVNLRSQHTRDVNAANLSCTTNSKIWSLNR